MHVHPAMEHSAALGARRASGSGTGSLSGPARDFESLLLNQWLQDAESSFGAAPGGDDDEDDAGGDQMKGLGTQQLAGFLADSGGIGIGRMIQKALEKGHAGQQHATGAPGHEPRGSSDATRSLGELRAKALALSNRTLEVAP